MNFRRQMSQTQTGLSRSVEFEQQRFNFKCDASTILLGLGEGGWGVPSTWTDYEKSCILINCLTNQCNNKCYFLSRLY